MFFEGSRIDAMREMILAESLEERRAALAKLYQREDFVGIGSNREQWSSYGNAFHNCSIAPEPQKYHGRPVRSG